MLRCDTNSENGKYGGYIDDGCLSYEFQPNPDYWPNCMYENCAPNGACTTGSVSTVGGTFYAEATYGSGGSFP